MKKKSIKSRLKDIVAVLVSLLAAFLVWVYVGYISI